MVPVLGTANISSGLVVVVVFEEFTEFVEVDEVGAEFDSSSLELIENEFLTSDILEPIFAPAAPNKPFACSPSSPTDGRFKAAPAFFAKFPTLDINPPFYFFGLSSFTVLDED